MESTKPSEPYQYTFTGGETNSYFFTTQTSVIYEIKFVPSTDYFKGYEALEVEVFEMVNAVADNPNGDRLPADARTAPTLFAIFHHFFLPRSYALIFICDSSDGRERARFRKFGMWFEHESMLDSNRDLDIAKFDQRFADGDDLILVSLIVSRRHPQQKLIKAIFIDLAEGAK